MNRNNSFLLKICLLGFSLFILSHILKLGEWTGESGVVLAENEAVFFTDVTDSAGVSLIVSQWGGVWGDYDGDGRQDLYAGNHFSSPNLYRNNGNGSFTDMRAAAGLKAGPDDWHGAAWGDYNNDGRLDLYVVTGVATDGSDFYVNNGNGTFTEQAGSLGIKNDPGRGRQPAWVDYNRDGDLDLFVANSAKVDAPSVLYRNNGSGPFTDVAVQAGLALTTGIESVAWADYNNDGYTDFIMTELGSAGGAGYRLYRNQGNGTFVETRVAAGLTGNHFPTSAAWGDYDNDGDLDLYFTRGYSPIQDKLIWSTNTITAIISPPSTGTEGLIFTSTVPTVSFDLWKTDRKQNLSEIAIGSANQPPPSNPFTLDNTTSHIGVPASNLGDISLIWRDSAASPWNIRWSRPAVAGFDLVSVITTPGEFTEVISLGLDIPPPLTYNYPNALYRNRGDGTFQLVWGLMTDPASNSQYAHWVDIDNDGDLDLYVTNMGNTYSGDEANRLYRNNNNGTFTDIAAATGLTGSVYGNDNCSAWADYNNDGFLDLYLANSEAVGPLAGPHKLYLNGGNANHWLEIKLIGTTSNRLGIGAKIQVATGALIQSREVGVGTSGPCQNSLLAHFGLDDYTVANAITVTWPSGIVQVLHNIPADQILNLTESQSLESDLTIAKTRAGVGEVVAGEKITYTIAITNNGPTTPVTATVVDTFNNPAALAGVAGPVGCNWTLGSATVTCMVSGVVTGAQSQLQLVVTTNAAYSGTLTNIATVSPTGGVVDPDWSDNVSSQITVTVIDNTSNNPTSAIYLPVIMK